MLELIAWDEEKLAYILKEDDFLNIKLGGFKLEFDEVTYRTLTAEESEQTKSIQEAMLRYVRVYDDEKTAEPFHFPYMTQEKIQSKKIKTMEYDVELTSAWTIVNQS